MTNGAAQLRSDGESLGGAAGGAWAVSLRSGWERGPWPGGAFVADRHSSYQESLGDLLRKFAKSTFDL